MAVDDTFLKHFLPFQAELLAYILSLGVDPASADDVLQDSTIVMMKKFEHFTPGTNFRAWAYAVVRFEVLKKRAWLAKQPLLLSDEIKDTLESSLDTEMERPIELEALVHCMGQLPERTRVMVSLRYQEKLHVKRIATQVDQPAASVYKTLSRARTMLKGCVEKFRNRQVVTA